jgi:poly(A) polymerase
MNTLLLNHPFFEEIRQVAERTKTECYVVGGYVRDIFLKRTSKDVDFVVMGDGGKFADEVGKSISGCSHFAYYANFGTAAFRYQDDLEIEFVGARKESYQADSRNPEVQPGTFQEDMERRDFTINALSIQIYPEFGKLMDPFGGLNDIQAKRIVTPLNPEKTFSDDPLRMMRAIRFATQLQFKIDPVTLQAIKDQSERITIISKERIIDELHKIILSKKPSIGFKLLFETGLLHHFFPEMVALHGVKEVDKIRHKDNFFHTLQVLDQIVPMTDDLWTRWAAILHDIAKPPTQKFEPGIGWTFHGHEELGARMVPGIFKRLRLPLNDKMKYVQKLVRLHLRPMGLNRDNITDSAIRRLVFDAGDDLKGLLTLCRADITSKNVEKVQRIISNLNLLEEKIADLEERDRIRTWQPPITGEIIMETFNIPASKAVGEIKLAVREAILDGKIGNEYDDAFTYMLEVAKQYGFESPLS